MNIGICAIIRNENLYLREWVEYHLALGFDKIILYDNNAIDGEYPHQVIGDYIMTGKVDVHNIRGREFIKKLGDYRAGLQPSIYNKCLRLYGDSLDWIVFIDVDEFITIGENEPQSIHEIFDKYDYENFDQVVLFWYTIGDDGKLNYENEPVQTRFNTHLTTDCRIGSLSDHWVKSIVKTSKKFELGFSLGNEHAIPGIMSCNEKGEFMRPAPDGSQRLFSNPIHDILYIKHYCTKSLWEHLARRAANLSIQDRTSNFMRIDDYKGLNGWTTEHEKIYGNFIEYISNPERITLEINI